jgi:hypothetical protein
MKERIARAIAIALLVLGLLAAATAPYGDPDTQKHKGGSLITDSSSLVV